MIRRFPFAPALAFAFAALATVVLAFTAEELLGRAQALQADVADLADRAEVAVPAEYSGLIAEYQQLQSEHAQLDADRATLGSCSCAELDAALAALDDQFDGLGVIIDTWDD